MKTLLALTSYYGTYNPPYGNSPSGVRLGYLRDTVNSLNSVADTVWIGVQNDADLRAVANVCLEANPVLLDCEPQFIPATLARMAQQDDGFADAHDLVYITDADQRLYIDPAVLSFPDERNYLSPHRWERLAPKGTGADRGVQHMTWEGNAYVLPERPEIPAVQTPFYPSAGLVDNYGGAFLSRSDFFCNLHFPDDPVMPVEKVVGFKASWYGRCYKTSDWKRFWVDHLSGYDYHKRLETGRVS